MSFACGPGKVLRSIDTAIKNTLTEFKFTCGAVAGLGACTPAWTPQKDTRGFGSRVSDHPPRSVNGALRR